MNKFIRNLPALQKIAAPNKKETSKGTFPYPDLIVTPMVSNKNGSVTERRFGYAFFL